jgi:3-oxoacyl-[acyl-carrier protein] reductase
LATVGNEAFPNNYPVFQLHPASANLIEKADREDQKLMSKLPLQDKIAWITGSSRGIGRVIADHLASLGAQIAIHGTTPHSTRAFNEADSLDAVAEEISQKHGRAIFPITGDLSDDATVRALVQQIQQQLGPIDILVNCAGGDIGAQGTMGENGGKPRSNDAIFIDLADITSVLNRNLMTCILCCRAVAPSMMERKAGWIVNIGSVGGTAGRDHGVIYGTAKAAVHHYSRGLAAQLRSHNVYVNVVAPGSTMTPRFLASRAIDAQQSSAENTLDRYGHSIEIARAVEFFVTPASSYVTGQVLRVDGGRQLWPA